MSSIIMGVLFGGVFLSLLVLLVKEMCQQKSEPREEYEKHCDDCLDEIEQASEQTMKNENSNNLKDKLLNRIAIYRLICGCVLLVLTIGGIYISFEISFVMGIATICGGILTPILVLSVVDILEVHIHNLEK